MLATAYLALSGCSVFGEACVESAPYSVLGSATDSSFEQPLEIRNYDSMVLVSTSMQDNGRNGAFRRLLNWLKTTDYEPVGEPYIAANNGPMTLPMFRKNEVLVVIKKR